MSSIIVPGLKVSQLPIATQILSQDAFYLVDVETDTSKKTTFATISSTVAVVFKWSLSQLRVNFVGTCSKEQLGEIGRAHV